MNILYVASEVARYAKTGGLADVSAALPRYLGGAGHDVRVFLPYYSRIDDRGATLEVVLRDIEIRLGDHRYEVAIVRAERPGEAPVHLVHCPALYHRASIYTSDPDEHLRFLVLTRAALEACGRMQFAPDVIHANDWQAALAPLTLEVRYSWDRLFDRTRTLLAIHNLNYQGVFRADIVGDTGLGDAAHLFHQDQLREGRLNFLLHGILYADGICTVSPTYAREIQTEEHGAHLDPFLRARSSTVVGILNGVDYGEWSPEHDPLIPARYSAADLSGKAACKAALLARMGLVHHADVPVIGIVSRLAGQKGFALAGEVLPGLLVRHGFQLVVLGSGEHRFEQMFAGLAAAFPRQVGFHRGFSNELAHLIEAGADMFLMPSRYEPCGLNQMYSLRYGTVPIVHRTGGLADTVQLWDPRDRTGTGIVFDHFNADGLGWAIEAALATYRDAAAWRQLLANGMAQNFSWDVQGKLYEQLYRRLTQATRAS
ncbi:MAG TPA: glycogen/starch synthase [Kofleriaceae bacterium]|nr:glycogen/starch synthase [Kofleriaceae bacterium]